MWNDVPRHINSVVKDLLGESKGKRNLKRKCWNEDSQQKLKPKET